MIEVEADDALATATHRWSDAPGVEQVVICSPDKDLTQCVKGERVVCWDRLRDRVYAEPDVIAKFGVPPASIPDYLALVGDDADGYPGLPGWGAKSTAAVLAKFGHLESIPADSREWKVNATSAATLARTLQEHRDRAFLRRDPLPNGVFRQPTAEPQPSLGNIEPRHDCRAAARTVPVGNARIHPGSAGISFRPLAKLSVRL
jgi:5'-3' exonuclease